VRPIACTAGKQPWAAFYGLQVVGKAAKENDTDKRTCDKRNEQDDGSIQNKIAFLVTTSLSLTIKTDST
jgi:hypothetical protein